MADRALDVGRGRPGSSGGSRRPASARSRGRDGEHDGDGVREVHGRKVRVASGAAGRRARASAPPRSGRCARGRRRRRPRAPAPSSARKPGSSASVEEPLLARGRAARRSRRRRRNPRTAASRLSKRRRPPSRSSAPEASRSESSSAGAAGLDDREVRRRRSSCAARAAEPEIARRVGPHEDDRRRRQGRTVYAGTGFDGNPDAAVRPYNLSVKASPASGARVSGLRWPRRPPSEPSPAEEPPTYSESAGAEYVLLPVLVFDKKGRFVDGLEQKDFRVRVEGASASTSTPSTATRARRSPSRSSWTPPAAWSIAQQARERQERDPAASSRTASRATTSRSSPSPRTRCASSRTSRRIRRGSLRALWDLEASRPDGPLRRGRRDALADDRGPQQQAGDPALHRRGRQRERADALEMAEILQQVSMPVYADRHEERVLRPPDATRSARSCRSTTCRCWPLRAEGRCIWWRGTRI